VPLQCAVVLGSPQFAKDHLDSMEGLVCGGAALAKGIKQRWLDVLGPAFVELYGMTEGFGTLARPALEEQPPGMRRGLADGGDGAADHRLVGRRKCRRGRSGKSWAEVRSCSPGTSESPTRDAACVWCDRDGLRFLRSGDIGYLDRDRNLHIVDRKKDMIISGGFNVYPSDIEAVLMTHPAAREAAVISACLTRNGEKRRWRWSSRSRCRGRCPDAARRCNDRASRSSVWPA
jgi:acyl-CoA synthetase (AMP-forming)/AMP-acid ligase II